MVGFIKSSTTAAQEQCKCCQGQGIQYSPLKGINVICPCCGGTGLWNPPQVVWK